MGIVVVVGLSGHLVVVRSGVLLFGSGWRFVWRFGNLKTELSMSRFAAADVAGSNVQTPDEMWGG
jgi:hypothetical protein